MQGIELLHSVGKNGKNRAIDVALIQALLKNYYKAQHVANRSPLSRILKDPSDLLCTHARISVPVQEKNKFDTERFSRLQVNGNSSPELIKAIEKFQKDAVELKSIDGKIDKNGKTFNKLIALQKVKPTNLRTTLFGPGLIPKESLTTITNDYFKKIFMQYLGLTISDGEDFLGFFEMLKADTDITDLRWAAYMIATAYHETTYSMIPRRETGKGKGKKYDKEYEVADINGIRGQKNKKYTNVYYGRGYVQLTWKKNYEELGKVLGYDNKLYIDPDLTLEKDIAYKVTSYGMRHGTFTTKKLSDYINNSKTDYVEARRIINGEDKKDIIAEYAIKTELLLRLASKPLSAIN